MPYLVQYFRCLSSNRGIVAVTRGGSFRIDKGEEMPERASSPKHVNFGERASAPEPDR